jgi:hypothetical protein
MDTRLIFYLKPRPQVAVKNKKVFTAFLVPYNFSYYMNF